MEFESRHLKDEDIQIYLDGEMSGSRLHEIERHMKECAGCRVRVEAWRVFFTTIDELPELPVPTSMQTPVMAKIRGHGTAHPNTGLVIMGEVVAIAALGAVLWPNWMRLPEMATRYTGQLIAWFGDVWTWVQGFSMTAQELSFLPQINVPTFQLPLDWLASTSTLIAFGIAALLGLILANLRLLRIQELSYTSVAAGGPAVNEGGK